MQRLPFALSLLLTVLGVARIASTYHSISQTSDETPNIACGMEWLDRGTYDYGPFHPPLARAAIAIGPYLSGLRSRGLADRWKEGNAILGSAPRYGKALVLARLGILPFFVLACAVVWLWARRLWGEWGAVAAVFLFSNTPPVLAHAGLATTDMAVAAGVATAVYAFTLWIEQPDARRGLCLGVAFALAFLAKFSAVLFVPVSAAGILLVRARPLRVRSLARSLAVAALISALLIWGAYRFSWGPMSQHVATDAADQPGIWRTLPASWLHALESTPVPAPRILDGLWIVHNHTEEGHTAYLLGHNRTQGWWYFFPVALAVKTPLGLLLLAAAGVAAMRRRAKWQNWAPAASAFAILLACLPATLNIGVRYVLPLYPMLAITAGAGAVYLWQWKAGRAAAAALLLWVAVSSWSAQPDYLAYFNEIAAAHPERFLVDSDLDWGQGMKQLEDAVRDRHISYMHVAVLYTGDYARLKLGQWDGLEPFQPVKGWVAVSYTMLKTYAWMAAQQAGKPGRAFDWLDAYRPTARVGKSILLYYIP